MGFKGILFFILYIVIYILSFYYLVFFYVWGWVVFYNPFVRRLLGFSIIIGNFLLGFGSSLYYLELDFDLGWGYIIYLVG